MQYASKNWELLNLKVLFLVVEKWLVGYFKGMWGRGNENNQLIIIYYNDV
jgi:hypothetical protein